MILAKSRPQILSVLVAQELEAGELLDQPLDTPLAVAKIACFPWLVGHGALYGGALGMADVRSKVRARVPCAREACQIDRVAVAAQERELQAAAAAVPDVAEG